MTINNSSNYQPAEYNVLSGDVNGQIHNITPGTSGYILTSGGLNAQPTFQAAPTLSKNYLLQNIQTFSSPGTYSYTPSSGILYCIIQCQAPGGGGAFSGSPTVSGGSGGGGGYAQLLASASIIGTSQSITIGTPGSGAGSSGQNGFNGGTTSVGALLSCTGGQGGFVSGTCGKGGEGAGGNLNISGQSGTQSFTIAAGTDRFPKFGGNSWLGFGSQLTSFTVAGNTNGPSGGFYGGGGLGGGSSSASMGGYGIVIITEYISN